MSERAEDHDTGRGPALTHLDAEGRARMVDVAEKDVTKRTATAEAYVHFSPQAFEALRAGRGPKGDALQVAELAGIMGAKRTSDLIPLCHPLPISGVKVSIEADDAKSAFRISAFVKITAKTGVEMEALTAASIAALTLYDMGKALDKAAHVEGLRLLEKTGGKSGDYRADA